MPGSYQIARRLRKPRAKAKAPAAGAQLHPVQLRLKTLHASRSVELLDLCECLATLPEHSVIHRMPGLSRGILATSILLRQAWAARSVLQRTGHRLPVSANCRRKPTKVDATDGDGTISIRRSRAGRLIDHCRRSCGRRVCRRIRCAAIGCGGWAATMILRFIKAVRLCHTALKLTLQSRKTHRPKGLRTQP